MNRLLWRLARMVIRHRRGRVPPASLTGPVWYFAYGSDMHERVFREARHMTLLETRTARLDGYRLPFAVFGRRRSGLLGRLIDFVQRMDQGAAGGRRPGLSAPADIAEAPRERVWGVLYLLPLNKLLRLDASEGRQYVHLWIDVEDEAGRTVHALTYCVPYDPPEGRPSSGNLSRIREAGRQRGLPAEYIAFLDSIGAR